MALYKYDGPYAEVDVRVAGEFVGTVEKGGSVSVPDELAAKTEWPSDHWTRQEDAPEAEEVPEEAVVSEGQAA